MHNTQYVQRSGPVPFGTLRQGEHFVFGGQNRIKFGRCTARSEGSNVLVYIGEKVPVFAREDYSAPQVLH